MLARVLVARRRSVGVTLLAATALVLAGCVRTEVGEPDPVDGTDPAAWATHALDPCAVLAEPGVRAVLRPTAPSHLVRPHQCVLEYRGPGGRPDRVLLELGDPIPPAVEPSPPVELSGLRAHQDRVRAGWEVDEPTCEVTIPLSERRAIRVRAADAGGDDDAACAVPRDVAREVARQLADPAALVQRAPADPLTRWEACDLVAALPGITEPPSSWSYSDDCTAELPARYFGFGALRRVDVSVEFGPEPGTPPLDSEVLPGSYDEMPVEVIHLPTGPAEQTFGDLDSLGPTCAVTFAAHRGPGAPPSHAVGRMSAVVTDSDDACGLARETAEHLRVLLAGPAPALPPPPANLGVPF